MKFELLQQYSIKDLDNIRALKEILSERARLSKQSPPDLGNLQFPAANVRVTNFSQPDLKRFQRTVRRIDKKIGSKCGGSFRTEADKMKRTPHRATAFTALHYLEHLAADMTTTIPGPQCCDALVIKPRDIQDEATIVFAAPKGISVRAIHTLIPASVRLANRILADDRERLSWKPKRRNLR